MQKAFTLVELLVVMAIMAILVGLGTTAAYKALVHAKVASARMEISQLEAALKGYKEKLGEYPPDGLGGMTTITQHVHRAFPRCPDANIPQYLSTLSPQNALVFWLGGLPDGNGVPSGFSADPTDPFDVAAMKAAVAAHKSTNGLAVSAARTRFYEFDTARLSGTVTMDATTTAGNISYQYWPQNAAGNKIAGSLVYFRAENGGYANAATSGWTDVGDSTGVVWPAVDGRVKGTQTTWVNPSSFQIWSAGLDLHFGNVGEPLRFPNFTKSDGSSQTDQSGYIYDDITNFTSSTIEDAIP